MDLFEFYCYVEVYATKNVIEKEGAERELEKMADIPINKPLNQKVGFYRSINDYGLG